MRVIDRVFRYGGDEFTVILPETNAAVAMQIAERLRAEVERQRFDIGGGKTIGFTVSIGVATYSQHVGSPERVIKAADVALYAAKQAGRNRVSYQETDDIGIGFISPSITLPVDVCVGLRQPDGSCPGRS